MASLRVMIVEDEMFVSWHMEDILQQLDIDVCATAANAADAIEKASRHQPDLVLMDVNLGRGPDGIEAAEQISRLTQARFIFVTAYSDAGIASRIEAAAPGSPILQKPATTALVESALAALFA